METIPLVDLKPQVAEVAKEVQAGWDNVLANTSFVLGREVREFEEAYAAFAGFEYCIGVASGSDALKLALISAGIGPGQRVIVPTNSFTATAMAVCHLGATPVLVDCDPDYSLIDLDQVAAFDSAEIQAVIPVHLFGQMAPMEPLTKLAQPRDWHLIEDAAQSHGASQVGVTSRVSTAAATSFYPGKNLGAYGDAGAILTNDGDRAGRLRRLRDHGSEQKYEHIEIGFNSRFDNLQAVVLSAKLTRIERWNELRRQAADYYLEQLADSGIRLPKTRDGNKHVWHLFVVRVPAECRDDVLVQLRAVGIEASIHYRVPIHLQPAFAHLNYAPGDLPNAEAAAKEMISLPMFPHITRAQQDRVVKTLVNALKGNRCKS